MILSRTLNDAIGLLLDEKKSPSRKANELDNRGSHFYLALYWAQALAAQTEDVEFAAEFSKCADILKREEITIIKELNDIQGCSIDIGGYYQPDPEKAADAMRPCSIFNKALEELG